MSCFSHMDESQRNAIQQAAEREWNSNSALRAEFGDNLKTYVAYRMAEKSNLVKVLGNGHTTNVNVNIGGHKATVRR